MPSKARASTFTTRLGRCCRRSSIRRRWRLRWRSGASVARGRRASWFFYRDSGVERYFLFQIRCRSLAVKQKAPHSRGADHALYQDAITSVSLIGSGRCLRPPLQTPRLSTRAGSAGCRRSNTARSSIRQTRR